MGIIVEEYGNEKKCRFQPAGREKSKAVVGSMELIMETWAECASDCHTDDMVCMYADSAFCKDKWFMKQRKISTCDCYD